MDKKRSFETFLLIFFVVIFADDEEPAQPEVPPSTKKPAAGFKSAFHVATTLFPSTMCSAFLEVIALLDDQAVSLDGTAVYEVAYEVVWSCLVEDSNLFLKFFMEKLTREFPEQTFQV